MSIVTKRVQAPQFYYYKHAQKNFWAHIDTPCLGPNKNSFRSLFESKYNHFLFFRASVYDRSIKQFILQSVSVCETPLDYFSML